MKFRKNPQLLCELTDVNMRTQ